MFQVFALDTIKIAKTSKQTNKIITTYKYFFGTYVISKKNIYTQYVLTSKNSSNQLFYRIWFFSIYTYIHICSKGFKEAFF